MTLKRLCLVVPLVALFGCGEGHSDLRAFIKDADKSIPRKIEPLPPVRSFVPFAYEGFDVPDPFKPRKLTVKQGAGENGIKPPSADRRKEPLESFPLEQLAMVGTIDQSGVTYALIRAEKTLYRVKKGAFMGQNFGLITSISDTDVKLKEIVQDTAGEWTERESVLPLQEQTGGKK